MGWSEGSEIGARIWALIEDRLPEEDRREVALGILEILEDRDCDTLEEAEALWRAAGRDHPEDDEAEGTNPGGPS